MIAPRVPVEALRSRFVYKALDAILTSRIGSRRGRSGSRYERTRTLTRALDRWTPRLAARVQGLLLRPEAMPFGDFRPEILAYGAESTVLRLATPSGPWVLKVKRASVGRGPAKLLALARRSREKHSEVRGWYAEAPGIVVPEQTIVLHGPLLGVPAVATLQPFVAGGSRDFFQDHDHGGLCTLLRLHPALHGDFVAFARATLAVARERGRCVDLVGRENLLVAPSARGPRLRLIDTGIFRLRGADPEPPERLARVEERLGRLARLLDEIA